MANGRIKIIELPEITSVSDDDIFIIENGVVTQKISVIGLINYIKEHKDIAEYYIKRSCIGEKNGVAPLDNNKKIPKENLDFGTIEGTIYDGSLGKALSDIINAHLADINNPHLVTKKQIGLSNADNTSDLNKPVSTKQQSAIDAAYANANAYTDTKIAALINGAPTTLDTLKELADALLENKDIVEALDDSIGNKANQSELDSHINNNTIHILASERSNWDETYAKKHEHENQAVLDSITAESIEKWNSMTEQSIYGNELVSDTEPDNQNINDYWIQEYE